MSWLFSQALVAEYSEENSLAGEPCALLSGNPTPLAYLPLDRMKAFSRLSLSGVTFRPVTDDLGAGLLTWFLAGSHARTSASQEMAPALTVLDPACGTTWQELSVRFDLNSFSWRTHRSLWDEDLTEFCLTFPAWGLMRDGVLWEQLPQTFHTGAKGSGWWPTPVKFDANLPGMMPKNGDSTRTDMHGKARKVLRDGRTASMGLSRLIIFMTGKFPKAEAFEELMAWPNGWTALAPLGMDKFQQWQLAHGTCSLAA